MKLFFSILLLFVGSGFVFAQPRILSATSYTFSATGTNSVSQLSNSITDMIIRHDTIWIGTGKGLSRSIDGGRTWKNYYDVPEFGKEDVSAIAVRGKDIWVATAHSVEKSGQTLPEGSGLRYSSDGGDSWRVIGQPLDSKNVDTLFWNSKSFIRALGITTAINNITYDIAIAGNAVYICSFAGMARVSTDTGKTWQRIILPPDHLNSISQNDSLVFDLSPSGGALGLQNNYNHRVFSVYAETDSIIWIGSAGGMNKTTDRGLSWTKFTKQTQANPISGNFIVSIGHQKTLSKNIMWAATINANDNTEKRGVSLTEDGGATWKQALLGEFPHNFGFKGDTVYVPTDNGVFRSTDFGVSWTQTGSIYDHISRQRYTQMNFFSAAAYGDTVWLGGGDGLVKSIDNSSSPFGTKWTILHASVSPTSATETYAYPNPFAPDDEIVRIHYTTGRTTAATVSLRIFDFGMNLVKTVVNNVVREQGREHDEIWDGQNEQNTFVSNGIYFYQLVIGNDESRWGKILVIK